MNYLRRILNKIPLLFKSYHLFLAWLGFVIYGNPSKRIFIVGVTGTKGKSTTLELINSILEEAGHKTALLSSIREKVGDASSDNLTGNTMPGRFFIQKFLKRAADAKCDFALVEVTSEGVKFGRHKFIEWDAAIFLNLHPEHIEAHGSFEKYRDAKVEFFKYIKTRKNNQIPMTNDQSDPKPQISRFFINKDDANSNYFEQVIRPELLSHRKATHDVIFFGKSNLLSSLVGEFNKYNIGAAEAFTRSVEVSEEIIERAVLKFPGVPGRMEFIQREPFAVVVDYAHTPDSLRKVYETFAHVIARAKPEAIYSRYSERSEESFEIALSSPSASPRNDECGKLICVFGSAGGGRDKWKRPEMGKIAAEYCDEIILTNEDPYDEPSLSIIEEIYSGISEIRNPKSEILNKSQIPNPKIQKIIDRKEAIKTAVSLAKPGDIVVITGKGSEKFIHIANGNKIPWSDKDTVLEFLKL